MHSASFNTCTSKIIAESVSMHKQYHHDEHSCVSVLLNTSLMFQPFNDLWLDFHTITIALKFLLQKYALLYQVLTFL
ncbi:Hypothetical protein TPAS_2812 [Trichococcus pasteurii]|uniref:Uncharacterized protein n=1 Tax=Trichococcus pasteurii TaxID=43064 RepID=A0A1W1IJH0_9LACT|nr:hypothetical protein SAMN04488086_11958 [Trichococcus pasteurii]SLM53085.1 Hypothetical protein TPAS_2812 [Trichococcus pasteurii]SSB93966.1 Hypothetical protein TPAS_2812 [Trichococcus pasteurii]